MKNYVIAIDPGTTESGVCIARSSDFRPLFVAKTKNEDVIQSLEIAASTRGIEIADCDVVIERMQGNNFRVGSDVFLTCEWIGRFDQLFRIKYNIFCNFVYRREEYKAICGRMYEHNDKGISDALVDRFCPFGTSKQQAKGAKNNPGWFYGFSKDCWQAYAQAVTFIDRTVLERTFFEETEHILPGGKS